MTASSTSRIRPPRISAPRRGSGCGRRHAGWPSNANLRPPDMTRPSGPSTRCYDDAADASAFFSKGPPSTGQIAVRSLSNTGRNSSRRNRRRSDQPLDPGLKRIEEGIALQNHQSGYSAHQLGIEAVFAIGQKGLLALHHCFQQNAMPPKPMQMAKRFFRIPDVQITIVRFVL